jgi:hypothetical protein
MRSPVRAPADAAPRRPHRLVAALLLALAALALHAGRRSFIRAFFVDATPQRDAPPALPLPERTDGPALGPTARTRVLLIDGLDSETAAALPRLTALCRQGLDLRLDIGFPTVSLPVQHALWSGLTQQQSGYLYRNRALRPPPRDTLPARSPGSIAVAQSHQYIVHSLGFSAVRPAELEHTPAQSLAWRDRFAAAAEEAVRAPARLVFVHVLDVDSAGHRHGRDSAAYRVAAIAADNLLARLLRAERSAFPAGGTRWFVLSDHGHRRGGGHADAEPEIRLVRVCLAGELPASNRGGSLHLVDLSRALADTLGIPPAPGAAGRPLRAALAAPASEGATVPRPSGRQWLGAAAVLLAGLLLSAGAARLSGDRWLLWLPWWWPVSYLGIVVGCGLPSLSVPAIYKPLGRDLYLAASPGLVLLLGWAYGALRQPRGGLALVALLAAPAAASIAVLLLCGGLPALVGRASEPPLMPLWSGHGSALVALTAASLAAAALVLLASAGRRGSGRGGPGETADRRA